MVAKTYQTWLACGEPYKHNGRMYIDVQKDSNSSVRRVRWYSEREYARMYKEELPQEKQFNQREILGFDPYIWIFKGDTYSALEWFRQSPCRYADYWGWYLPAAITIPEDLPENLTPIQLDWSVVGEGDSLKDRNIVNQAIEEILYADVEAGEWVGEPGDRMDLLIEVENTYSFEGAYGITTIHTMRGDDGNIYMWSTAAKHWEIGDTYHIVGTLKEHKTYKGVNQNWLTRCRVIND